MMMVISIRLHLIPLGKYLSQSAIDNFNLGVTLGTPGDLLQFGISRTHDSEQFIFILLVPG